MKNTLTDLNNHLFAQIERLGEEGLEGDKLKNELDRTNAVTGVAKEIINNARLMLDVQVKISDLPQKSDVPRLLK